ncbi:HAD family hydrolase [Nocardia sp. alder85J]|uniref:HAD family hydrolase n=1 Tax=Nocardia sp. alder85J TaxID=2862949 RepID=UPI001CD34061|nr:HAD-IB family hydrolase [Nocardia sp. alder85J]MCX4097067.1 HAD-IB family hydrolase [Nocardia sp. alder85J]
MSRTAAFAFTDVDHTLLRISTLHHFAEFFFEATGRAPVLAVHRNRMRRLAETGAPREALNREYYQLWAGISVAEVESAAGGWHELIRAHQHYRSAVVTRLRALAAEGVATVLLSGSFTACLRPIAAEMGGDGPAPLLCTELAERDGAYTGEVRRSLIGAAKRAAVEAFVAGYPGHDLADDYGFGDHVSDVAILERVGHPAVVPVDPALEQVARQRGWEVLTDRIG